jgi:putative oxidoreductase
LKKGLIVMNLGLFIVRFVVGALFIGHGTQKLFGWFGGHGLEGSGRFFEQIGYTPGRLMATIGGMTEAGGGALLMMGFLTPLGCAAIVGMMVGTLPVHGPKGLWNTNGGFELPLVYATCAALIAFAGPGRASIDAAIGWSSSGPAIGTAAVAFGALTGVVMLAVRAGRMERAAHEPEQPQQRRAA